MNQDKPRKLLAQNIKNLRKELGITQAKLAELAEISEPYMNDIERCQTWVSDKTLSKLAWALNVQLHELFINDNSSNKSLSKKEMYSMFNERKHDIKEYIDKSFDTLMRTVVK